MNVPVFIYKIIAPHIPPAVLKLFDNSLSEGIFPKCFKKVKIIIFLKSGDSISTVNLQVAILVKNIWKIYVCYNRLLSEIYQYFMYKSVWLQKKIKYIRWYYRNSWLRLLVAR